MASSDTRRPRDTVVVRIICDNCGHEIERDFEAVAQIPLAATTTKGLSTAVPVGPRPYRMWEPPISTPVDEEAP